MSLQEIPLELRFLIREVTDLWGDVVRTEGGARLLKKVENLRQEVKHFRSAADFNKEFVRVQKLLHSMAHLSSKELEDVTHAFAVLLELINQCENAVRSHKIRQKRVLARKDKTLYSEQEIYFVLTAHPTESRSPEIVETLQNIQSVISRILLEQKISYLEELVPYLKKMWFLRLGRTESPRVRDEADFIYSLVFRREILDLILESKQKIFLRTWVGGDKDGHPGVDENVTLESLTRSRARLLQYLDGLLKEIEISLQFEFSTLRYGQTSAVVKCRKKLKSLQSSLKTLEVIRAGDLGRVKKVNQGFMAWQKSLPHFLAVQIPGIHLLRRVFEVFPALVLPLEFRENSEVFRNGTKGNPAILRMLKKIRQISAGHDPRSYVRGLIISMTESIEDIKAADAMLLGAFGNKKTFPVIPLFERTEDLARGPQILREWIRLKKLKKFEVMLGYSDSSKEAGVFPSRLAIQKAVREIEALSIDFPKIQITYFHGSGGSVDRGGGKIEDQTSYWPASALVRFKATLQGEMIQRTFSTPEILEQYLWKINDLGLKSKKQKTSRHQIRPEATLETFAKNISAFYRDSISNPQFLNMVEEASAYRFLEALHFGSRPSKRKKLEGISSLRAIPWILSWTQTRILLPTWWGMGTAYQKLSVKEKAELKKMLQTRSAPLFSSFVQQVGFTLTKVEMPIWFLYLKHSSLSQKEQKIFTELFLNEYRLTVKAVREINGGVKGKKDLLWFRPWLKESIRLRSPLIHPLNVAQILAWERKNANLLRDAAVGIACGMLTTG